MENISVLIVDDRDIIRDSLKVALSRSNSIVVKEEASDGVEAIRLIENNNFDVVLMDINMPNMNGVEATRKIRSINSQIRILANSFSTNPSFIKDMVSAGASGFIRKGESGKSYIEAIESVSQGFIHLSEEVNDRVYDKVLGYLKSAI